VAETSVPSPSGDVLTSLRHQRTLRALIATGAGVAAAHFAAGSARGVPEATQPSRPLVTGVVLPGSADELSLARTRAAGASVVRLNVNWRAVAPAGAERPAEFDATDPSDPAYEWADVDERVKAAVEAGLEPILTLVEAPDWAAPTRRDRGQDGPTRPDPAAYGQFAEAAARRYSGATLGLPRVRYWQAWNEPNVSIYLMPQTERGRRVSPFLYRRLVNAFTDAVHRVRPDNVSIAGGLSPFSVETAAVETVGPLRFLRDLLCLSAGAKPKPTCGARVRFDALAVHPYTSGDPLHEAANPNDVSLGDLPELRPLLRAAVAAGHLTSRSTPQIWVTEFSWDTNPPDPGGVPLRLHARWTSEALFRMWENGITHVTWFLLRDEPRATSDFQSGLYMRGSSPARDRPKPALQAFRFPFVAFGSRSGIDVWGRTPGSTTASARIDLRNAGRWRTIGRVRADPNGIFRARLSSASTTGSVRAVLPNGQTTLPFSLRIPPDRTISPFGLPNER
jgi:hypothetical protein